MATKQVYGKYGTLAKMYSKNTSRQGLGRSVKICPNICTASTVRRTNCLIRCMKSCPSRMNSRGRGIISPMCADKVNCGRG